MTQDGGNVTPRIDRAEHIGPLDTGDNIEAKRVAGYGFNTNSSTWVRQQVDDSGNVKVAGTFSSTPPADVAPATQNITIVDSASVTTGMANNQSIIIGTPTAGSAATFNLSSIETVRIEVTGIWTGTISTEISIDGGTVWVAQGVHQGAYTTSSFTQGFVGGANVAGATQFRVRATAAITGTVVVKIIESTNTQSVYIANAAPSGTVISALNSSSATLTSGSVYTGTGEDVTNFSEMRVSVFSNVASATDGLSVQQSSDNTNWDITDTYTVAASTAGQGKTFVVPRQARYFRVVYTNGGTNQTSFRLQTILNRTATTGSSQRATDGYTNETDLEQGQSFLMGYNGATWDRLRTTGTGVLSVSTTSDTPGTGATNLGKAEDAAHTSGDTGVAAWGVRNDNLATTYGQDQDYGPLATDLNGRVMVAQKAATATLSNVSTSGTTATLLAANSARIGATITNEATTVIYIKFGTTASATSYTVTLAGAASAPYSYYEVPAGYTGRIDGILASSTGTARVTEIT